MLDQVWDLNLYSWDDNLEPPLKLYCIPIDPYPFPEA